MAFAAAHYTMFWCLKKKRGTPKTHRQHISLLSFRSGSCQQEYRLPARAGGWESLSFKYLQTGDISKLRRVLYLWDDHSTRIPPAIIRIGKTDEAKISIKMDDETKLWRTANRATDHTRSPQSHKNILWIWAMVRVIETLALATSNRSSGCSCWQYTRHTAYQGALSLDSKLHFVDDVMILSDLIHSYFDLGRRWKI